MRISLVKFNLISLLFNIYFLFEPKNQQRLSDIEFKHADNFTFFLSKILFNKNHKDEIKNKNQTINIL